MNWIRRFMEGRYGIDQLSIAFIILFIIFNIVTLFARSIVISIIYVILFAYFVLRIMSRNIPARQKENYFFLKLWTPIQTYFKRIWSKIKNSKKYKYFRCSECKKEMRVPRGKGKIIVTCPKCGNKQTRKT